MLWLQPKREIREKLEKDTGQSDQRSRRETGELSVVTIKGEKTLKVIMK